MALDGALPLSWGLFRHRARALSAQTRGPYSVRPWSAAVKNILFFKLPEEPPREGQRFCE